MANLLALVRELALPISVLRGTRGKVIFLHRGIGHLLTTIRNMLQKVNETLGKDPTKARSVLGCVVVACQGEHRRMQGVREMALASKKTVGTNFVVGIVPDGKTFASYLIPGGTTVRVLDSDVFKKALAKSEGPIQKSIEDIKRRHGTIKANE